MATAASEKEPEAAAPTATFSIASARPALAKQDLRTGTLTSVIPDRELSCAAPNKLPPNCERAWHIRLELPVEAQREGRYQLEGETGLFAYRDAQDKNIAGPWGAGAGCRNLGAEVSGTLQIVGIDAEGINGILSGAAEADGPFRAVRCPGCRGTGMACKNVAQCCNDACDHICIP
jgi:hypothetical protein